MQGNNININWVPGITLEEMEKQCILSAFRFYRENKTQTAGALGIAIRTLDSKLEKYQEDFNAEERRSASEADERQRTLDRLRGVEFTTSNSVGHIYQPTKQNAEASEVAIQAAAGVHAQSPAKIAAQHEMSMSQRQEVQSVLQGQTQPVGNKRAGKRL
ncbi:unnamed protein product [Sphagnum jensenii]|uniref:DNA binding HTH domain-containing protein n=1 Tax=Sphagnum jensenii TaxID=128206 RepID=A0ABP0V890_9BRYO